MDGWMGGLCRAHDGWMDCAGHMDGGLPCLAVLGLLHLAEQHVRLVLEVLPGDMVHGGIVAWCNGEMAQLFNGSMV